MKRGLASPCVHSALAMTRRLRLQLSSVLHWKSLKRRAGSAGLLGRRLAPRQAPLRSWRPGGRCGPARTDNPRGSARTTPSAPRAQSPESARSTMRTNGQRARICRTIRATSSTLPAPASMSERRSLARQQMPAAEHVKRQIAVAVVIAVEKAALLMPVQRIVGGVEIEDDLLAAAARAPPGTASPAALRSPPRHRRSCDSASVRPAQLQPVQRRLAGHWRAVLAPRRKLARQHRHQRIVAQFVMVVEVFVAERDRQTPAARPASPPRARSVRPAPIAKAIRKATHQINRPIGRSQKQRSRIRRHQSGIKCRIHCAAFHHSKIKLLCATLCRHRGSPRIMKSRCGTTTFADSAPRCA